MIKVMCNVFSILFGPLLNLIQLRIQCFRAHYDVYQSRNYIDQPDSLDLIKGCSILRVELVEFEIIWKFGEYHFLCLN